MEGTPHAFSDLPMLYEIVRAWLSSRLEINPLEIKLIGSARTGFSLAPPPNFGRPFDSNSDLDIVVVSNSLFSKCKIAFEQWKTDYQLANVTPRKAIEKFYWDENLVVGSRSLQRGFIDSNMTPTFNRYPIAQTISQAMWLLKSKLDISPLAPKIRKATIRVYNNWDSFHKRVKTNFNHASYFAANSA
jgi:hypothetical protein